MSDGDGDDEAAPFADLLDAIEEDGTDEDVWARLAAEVGADVDDVAAIEDDDTDVWQRLSGVASESETPIAEPRPGRIADRTPAWATLSNSAKILHGYLTVLSLGAALAIYVAAAVGLIPRWLWILSLPPFALGVVLLIPILAWYLGVWDPTRIA